jgi:hypothetical protein
MAGIMAALKTHDALRVVCQPVDDFALTFITPLRTDNNNISSHDFCVPS